MDDSVLSEGPLISLARASGTIVAFEAFEAFSERGGPARWKSEGRDNYGGWDKAGRQGGIRWIKKYYQYKSFRYIDLSIVDVCDNFLIWVVFG